MYQYDGGFAESLFSGKGLLSVRCRAPNDFSVGSSGGSGIHQNPGHGGRMWRPLYRGSFKDGTYEGLGHLFHIQWENYKDGGGHASTDANKAEGRTGGRTSSATFVKPPQTSNVVKYRGAFVGGEMTGQGTRYVEVFLVHVGCTRCLTSSTDHYMKIHARKTLGVEFIRASIFLFLFYV